MLGADGDGGLSLGLEMKQFEPIGGPFESEEEAKQQASLLYGETVISEIADHKFIIWYRPYPQINLGI